MGLNEWTIGDAPVTVLALHGRRHTGDALVRNLQAWDGFTESAIVQRVE